LHPATSRGRSQRQCVDYHAEHAGPIREEDYEIHLYRWRFGLSRHGGGRTRRLVAGVLSIQRLRESSFVQEQDIGRGKYQVSVGANSSLPLGSFGLGSMRDKVSVAPLIQQVVSVAGDPSRKDINYTKLELALHDGWRNYALKLTLKPVIDWEQDGATGAVTELEGRMSFGRGWAAALMLGHRTWAGISSTYGTRVEVTLGRTF
jgi:hypothetical protein